VIIRESTVDTPATIRNIRTQLSSLDQYMIHFQDDNIETFNQHVRTLVKNLNSRGQETHDLLVNLFKGYLSAKDYQFNRYIQQKQDDYDEGKTMDPEKLMTLAYNKYKVLVEEETWTTKSSQEEKIMALELKITNLTQRSNQLQANTEQSNRFTKFTGRKMRPFTPEEFSKY